MTPPLRSDTTTVDATSHLLVSLAGTVYTAEEIARGAAFKLFSPREAPGFTPGPQGWYRYVHAAEVDVVRGSTGSLTDPLDAPLRVPLSRHRTWADVHRLTQTGRGDDQALRAIRRTAVVRRGTRMVKILSAHQVGGYLRGWLPAGFCFREYDVAHLRTPAELRLLRTDADTLADAGEVTFALRWRAVDDHDYQVPSGAEFAGLVAMPPHDRVGPPVLGTGFAPSDLHVIPEFVTAGMADLPLPANATLLAYTADGTEVVLYAYQPEQRGWLRMVGQRWRHLLHGLGDGDGGFDQEYVPVPARGRGTSRLVGWFRGQEFDTVADPPDEFRVLAMSRAARYPVEGLARRTRYATWRGAHCTVVRDDGSWVRVRLCRPTPDLVGAAGAQCHERGVYEAWVPAGELTDRAAVDQPYPLPVRALSPRRGAPRQGATG